jgi:hypothetical protein
MNLPNCTGYQSWTDCGYEFDCEAVHGQSCEDCLCTYKSLGGLWHPETGKKVWSLLAFILYGVRSSERETIVEEEL